MFKDFMERRLEHINDGDNSMNWTEEDTGGFYGPLWQHSFQSIRTKQRTAVLLEKRRVMASFSP